MRRRRIGSAAPGTLRAAVAAAAAAHAIPQVAHPTANTLPHLQPSASRPTLTPLQPPSGNSKGTAYIVFEQPQHALDAYQRYNNVALDGRKLVIELVETEIPPGTFAKLSSGIK
jgi:hypothetical protein